MKAEKNWLQYRSLVKEKLAIFSINLAMVEQFTELSDTHTYVVQFSFPYTSQENGLPTTPQHQELIKEIFKISTLVCTLDKYLYAGYVLSDQKATLYFYCENPVEILDVLQQFPQTQLAEAQEDPVWDLYFDFLLPSSLEMKINATQDVINMMELNGRDISDIYSIEHNFHFENEEDMLPFLEHISTSNIPFVSLRHTEFAVPLDDTDENVYVVRIEQELSFNNSDIFNYIETFEQLAQKFSGEYIGWEGDNLVADKKYLN